MYCNTFLNKKKNNMKLYLEGYRSNNKYMADTIITAAHYYAHKLLGGHLYPHITLDVKLVKDMHKKTGGYGFCSIDGDAEKPREFLIELDSSKENLIQDLLIWLSHEMVHLKQFARGELTDYEDGRVKWKSKLFRSDKIDYSDAPWEKEAYRIEYKLYEEFWNVMQLENNNG